MNSQRAICESETALDEIIRISLTDFHYYLKQSQWIGRENEAVSLFAFGFLIAHCRHGSILYDPSQVAIECAVPQNHLGTKKQVRKDLLIWPSPRMTCWNESWNPVHYPASVMEWKVIRKGQAHVGYVDGLFAYDVDWLRTTARTAVHFTGYSICLDVRNGISLQCGRIHGGEFEPSWLIKS